MNNADERHIIDTEIRDEAELYNHLMHMATYKFALKFVEGKRTLDYGCGTGYGSHMLASVADNVTAVDVSNVAIEHAKNIFSANNLAFKTISGLSDEKFDVITSFQVIEHVPDDKEYLKNLKSLLNPGGCLIISTPDKNNRLFKFIQKPWNIFHLKEYSYKSFNNLLHKYFFKIEVLKIGSKSDLVLKEIMRTKKQRMISLPSTLFFYPNFLRGFLLNFQASIFKTVGKFKKDKKSIKNTFDVHDNFKLKYSVEDIEISNDVINSTDLLAICFK
jgi:2-polyprenyl-3-methyl-5-hydroxy-6-metoxy-1,4-benzoquinol methylase